MAKNQHKLGNRKGSPAYRTPSSFRSRKHLKTVDSKRMLSKYRSKYDSV